VTGRSVFVLEQHGTIGGDVPLHEYPNPTAYIERVEGRDSYEAIRVEDRLAPRAVRAHDRMP
jgi:hypothetical protein